MEPYFKSEGLSLSEKMAFNKFSGKTLVLIKKLKESGNFNKDYKKETEKIYEICNYSNWCFTTFYQLKLFIEEKELPKPSKPSKYDLTEEGLKNLYDICSIHSALICYKIIELSFKAILKGVSCKLYGRTYTVNGKEGLGQIEAILTELLPEVQFFWDEIDRDFRNSLAHGRYLVKNHKFIYYTKSDFSDPKELSREELREKIFTLSMMALVIASVIGNWLEIDKFNVNSECEMYYTK